MTQTASTQLSSPLNSMQSSDQLQLPHDIHGLLAKPLDWPSIVGVSLGVFALVVAGYALYKRVFGREKTVEVESLYDKLLRDFEACDYDPTIQGERLKNFYFDISMILKGLLENYFQKAVIDKTLSELHKLFYVHLPIKKHPESSEWLAFFERAESVKFAGAQVNSEVLAQDYQNMSNWIKQLDPTTKIELQEKEPFVGGPKTK